MKFKSSQWLPYCSPHKRQLCSCIKLDMKKTQQVLLFGKAVRVGLWVVHYPSESALWKLSKMASWWTQYSKHYCKTFFDRHRLIHFEEGWRWGSNICSRAPSVYSMPFLLWLRKSSIVIVVPYLVYSCNFSGDCPGWPRGCRAPRSRKRQSPPEWWSARPTGCGSPPWTVRWA